MSKDKYKQYEEKKRAEKARKKGRVQFLIKAFFGGLVALLLALVVIAAVFEKQIASMVIKTLNKQLQTELRVSEASLSLIRKFPQAAVYLYDAQIDGVGGHEEKLLDVSSISLQCGILGLLMGNYNFTSISIDNGTLFVHHAANGAVNYDIFKASEEEAAPDDGETYLNLSISNAYMGNVALHYVDEASEQDVKVRVKSADFSGNFMIDNTLNQNEHTMISNAELYSEYIKMGETVYLRGVDLAYDGALQLDLAAEHYSFDKIRLYVKENEFQMDGSIQKEEKGRTYDLVFNSEQAMLGSLLQLIPEPYAATLGQLESYGDLNFEARVNGMGTKRANPIIEVKFGLKDGRIMHPKMEGSMRGVNFDVNFNNGNGIDDQTAKVELKNFQAYINNEPINLSWEMIGLETPIISMAVDGKIPLNAIHKFLGEQVTEGSGFVQLTKLTLDGRLKDMMSMYRIPRVALHGQVDFDQAHLIANNIPIDIPSGQMTLENNTFNVRNILLNTAESALMVNGAFHNVLPVLLSDSLNTQKAKLTFEASLNAEKLDVDEFLAIGSGYSTEQIEAAPEIEQDSLIKESYERRAYRTSFLQGSFITNIKEFYYGNVSAANFNGEVSFDQGIMRLKEVKVDAMDGSFELNSKVYFEQEPRVELFLDCRDIDLQEFLLQTENFGQEVLTSDNLRGRLNSLIKVNIFLDSLGNFKQDDLYVVADVEVLDGELIRLKMLESFSSFIKMRDLQHISFTKLNNQFKIENGTFHLPAMFIQSNALNLLIGGQYKFSHDFDFKLKINAGQVVANKFKRYNPDKPAIKARRNGLFNIYAHIFGNLYGEYEYKLGPKHSKKYLEAQLQRDLPALANTLRTEFAQNASSTGTVAPVVEDLTQPSDWEDIPEYEADDDAPEEYLDGF